MKLGIRSLIQGGVLGLGVGGWLLVQLVPAGSLGTCFFLTSHELYAAGAYALAIALFTSAALAIGTILWTLEEEIPSSPFAQRSIRTCRPALSGETTQPDCPGVGTTAAPAVARLFETVQAESVPGHFERRGRPIPIRLPGSYLDHWGLLKPPFENTPDPTYYFPSSHHQEALHRLLYGVKARKGAVMLTGEIGCGKTLMSRTLLQQLPGDAYDTALIASPVFEATHLLREVLYQLGIEAAGTAGDLLHRLNDRLLDNHKRKVDTVLIIDEAQAIRDERMFEEIRLMLNFQLNDRFLLTLVLLGQPELKARVESLTQLSQRVAIRHHLGPFTAQETGEYVRYRLNLAGGNREAFTDEACALIHGETGGIPRRINSLCDLCLLLGSMDEAGVIDRPIVLRAGAEIAQGRRR